MTLSTRSQYNTEHIGGVIALLVLVAVTVVGTYAVIDEQRELATTLGFLTVHEFVNTSMTDNIDNWDNAVEGNATNVWYDTSLDDFHRWGDWAYRQFYIIREEMVENENIENFVFLLDITNPNLADNAMDNGDDIKFLDIEGVQLSHEIENYDNVTGHLTAWIRLPILYDNEDTNIAMYFGNPTATNQEDVAGVWRDYAAVYHFNDTPTGAAGDIDDSADNNEGSSQNMLAGDLVDGKISGALDFDGANDHVDISAFADNFVSSGLTILTWVETDGSAVTQGITRFSDSHTGYTTNLNSTDYLVFAVESAAADATTTNTDPVVPDTWYFIASRYNSGVDVRTYLNGNNNSTSNANINNPLTNPSLSATNELSYEGAGNQYFNGAVDEVQIYAGVMSEPRILAMYRNQNDNTYLHEHPLENGEIRSSIYTDVTNNTENFDNGIWWQSITFSNGGSTVNSAILTFSSRIETRENILAIRREVYIDDGTENHLVFETDNTKVCLINVTLDVSDIVDSAGTYTAYFKAGASSDNTKASSHCDIGWDDINLEIEVFTEGFAGAVLEDIEHGMNMVAVIMTIMIIAVIAIFAIGISITVTKKEIGR